MYQGTCDETCVTLRIYPDAMDPDEVSRLLGVAPTSTQRKGERPPSPARAQTVRLNGWFLSSREHVKSKDSQEHLDWLFARLGQARPALERLAEAGAQIDVACFWISSHGNGGPTLSPERAAKLGELGLTLWYDVYFGGVAV